MARVYFTRNFDYYPRWPSKNVLVAYRAGQSYTVKRECAEQAVGVGCGIEEKPPARKRSRKASAE
jgi:hypothetical protein